MGVWKGLGFGYGSGGDEAGISRICGKLVSETEENFIIPGPRAHRHGPTPNIDTWRYGSQSTGPKLRTYVLGSLEIVLSSVAYTICFAAGD